MARPIPPINLRDVSKLNEEATKPETRSYFDFAIDRFTSDKSSRNLVFGTVSGWLAGVTVIRVGKIAAFGLGGGILILHFATECGYINVNWDRVREAAGQSQARMERLLQFVKRNSCYSVGFVGGFFFGIASALSRPLIGAPPSDPVELSPRTPQEPLIPIPKLPEPYKPSEEPNTYLEKPPYLVHPKPILHSPKISPSSIPNPSPSITATKHQESGYPSYGGYLYNIPGYSAFQPVSYPGVVQPTKAPIPQNEPAPNEYMPFPIMSTKDNTNNTRIENEKTNLEANNVTIEPPTQQLPQVPPVEVQKPQTDFEEHFTPEIVPATSKMEIDQTAECKMSITSLSQGSGATVTIPSPVQMKETKPKPVERFSLKTSIPISKIDLKCVNNPPDSMFQNSMAKKTAINQPFQNQKADNGPRVEIQSNIIVKPAQEPEVKEPKPSPPNNSISTLINAAEAINKTENQFRKPIPKPEVTDEVKETVVPTQFTTPVSNSLPIPIFNPINVESSKVNFSNKPPDQFNDQKNQILFIQNKNSANPKMLLTIQQPNPQVLLQRTNFESKNLQAPSRLSNQSKKCKEELVNDNGTSSKVVALKRLHQENCDENDFENLITENQIYGNKIVVKEKSQGTQQEQDLKNKIKVDKPTQSETKNVVIQPNFVYLSNVQFSQGNLMMIKNNTKVTQTPDTNIKPSNVTLNENKACEVSPTANNLDVNTIIKSAKPQNIAVSKEIHVIKASNSAIHTLANKNTKNEIIFQTANQKVIVNSQIVYQVPMLVETESKNSQPLANKDHPKLEAQNDKKEFVKPFDPPKPNDKLFIACPYQMDSKLQPKIVITNIRPKMSTVEEVSSLDLYEKRRRLRRLKYLSSKDTKEQKTEVKKGQEKKVEVDNSNIITPEKMTVEIYKEFANTKVTLKDVESDSGSDDDEDDLKEYSAIIEEFRENKEDDDRGKVEFLSCFRLGTHRTYKEKEFEKQVRILKFDSVASAYIAAGKLKVLPEEVSDAKREPGKPQKILKMTEQENGALLQRKLKFLKRLDLNKTSSNFKASYERAWQEVIKDRNRRYGVQTNPNEAKIDLDPNGQLLMLTEIKKCVSDNNNLIKKRLDSNAEQDGDSIKVLAEKNFSELNRLSKMADRSVKIFSGQDTRKRDLNPGFDSENIQKQQTESKSCPNINIPTISNIISLKSTQESSTAVMTTQATSMDEPESSAAGVKEMLMADGSKVKDFSCQVEEVLPWPGYEAVMRSYKEYDTGRRKEIADLHRRNTALRVECAHVTCGASRDSDRARALLAERQNLSVEENNLKASVLKLEGAVKAIRNC